MRDASVTLREREVTDMHYAVHHVPRFLDHTASSGAEPGIAAACGLTESSVRNALRPAGSAGAASAGSSVSGRGLDDENAAASAGIRYAGQAAGNEPPLTVGCQCFPIPRLGRNPQVLRGDTHARAYLGTWGPVEDTRGKEEVP